MRISSRSKANIAFRKSLGHHGPRNTLSLAASTPPSRAVKTQSPQSPQFLDEQVYSWGKRALMYFSLLGGAIVGGSLLGELWQGSTEYIAYRKFVEYKDAGRLRGEIVVGREEVYGSYLADDGKTVRKFLTLQTDQNLVRSLQERNLAVKEVTQYGASGWFFKAIPTLLSLLITVGTFGFFHFRNRRAMEHLRTLFNDFEDRLRNYLHLNDKSKTTLRKVMEVAAKRIAYFAEHQAEFEGFVHLRNANEHFGRRMNVFAAPPSEDYLAEMANHIQNLFNPFLLSGFVQNKPKIFAADLPVFSALHHLRRGSDYLLFRKANGDLFFFTHRSFLNWAEATFQGEAIALKGLDMRSIIETEHSETHIVFETPYLLLEDALAHLADPKNQTRYFVMTQDGSSQGEVMGVVDGRQLRVI